MTKPHFEFDANSITFLFKNSVVVRVYRANDGLGDVAAWDLDGLEYDFVTGDFWKVGNENFTRELMNSDEIARFLWELSV
jgi:hypothetical protein